MGLVGQSHLSARHLSEWSDCRTNGRETRGTRDLYLELVHNRRFHIYVNPRHRRDHPRVSSGPWTGGGARLLHAQRSWHVVYVPRPGSHILCAAEAVESSDLLICVGRSWILDEPCVLPRDWRTSFRVFALALVVSDVGDRFQRWLLVPVWAGTANFGLTMRAYGETVRRSYALPFIVVGVAYYFLGSTQGTVEAFRSLQTIWHFSNFTIGHSHATMYGFITFIAWGAIYALLPRATGKAPNLLATGLHFWFATIGVTAYVVALSIGGTLQGLTWAAGNPFIASVDAAAPYWVARAVAGTLMFLSHVIFAYNVYLMTLAPKRETIHWQPSKSEETETVTA